MLCCAASSAVRKPWSAAREVDELVRAARTFWKIAAVGPDHVAREGQVLDRGPPVDEANLGDLVVRVADGDKGSRRAHTRNTNARGEAGQNLGSVAVRHLSPRTIQRGTPVGSQLWLNAPRIPQVLIACCSNPFAKIVSGANPSVSFR